MPFKLKIDILHVLCDLPLPGPAGEIDDGFETHREASARCEFGGGLLPTRLDPELSLRSEVARKWSKDHPKADGTALRPGPSIRAQRLVTARAV